jgi:predicted dinucleotide-binding enzyme
MNIGIIGAGNIGGTLTRRLTAVGHKVSVANSRGPATLPDNVVVIDTKHLLEFGRPGREPNRFALPLAGDDANAKGIVMRLVDELGFDPVDAGGLDESWRQQPATPVYAADLDADGVQRALAAAKPERKPEWRFMPATPASS